MRSILCILIKNKMMKERLFLLAVLLVVTLTGCITSEEVRTPPIVGGDRDEHGCIGSAGYSWNEEKQECTRPWEDEQEGEVAEIPENCTSWFDGCNNCFVNDGKIGGCTRMYCAPEMMKEPKCAKFNEE